MPLIAEKGAIMDIIRYRNNFDSLITKNYDTAIFFIDKAIELAEKNKLDSVYIKLLILKANSIEDLGDFDNAIKLYEKAIESIKSKDLDHLNADLYNNLAAVYINIGDYQEAIKYLYNALSIEEQFESPASHSAILNNLGLVHLYQENYEKALDFFNESLKIKKELNDTKGIALTYTNIGAIYYYENKIDSAIIYFEEIYRISKEIEDLRGQSSSLFNIGEIYSNTGKYDLALKYLKKSLQIDSTLNDKEGIAKSLNLIGRTLIFQEEYNSGLNTLLKTKNLANEIGLKSELKDIYYNISNAYKSLDSLDLALNYYVKYNNLKDTIFNIERTKQIEEIETKYQTRQKQQKIELQQALLVRQNIQKVALVIGIIFSLIITIVFFRSNRIRKRANELLSKQKKEIENQKNKITSSIEYAKLIQSAALPPYDFLSKILPEHFVLFLPRDIVSGDFYWATIKDNQTIIAAADCTGHGVPGAFMSMLGVSFLTEIVNREEILEPSIILNKLRDNVIESLHQTGKIGEMRDGLDIALCIINEEMDELKFAGAFNPLVIIRNENLIQIPADKMPIGLHETSEPFSQQTVPLLENDMIYLFSDGYADQFGGPFNKKFKMQPFYSLLLANYDKPMVQQKQILYDTILNWKGDIEQIDDILILGFRVRNVK